VGEAVLSRVSISRPGRPHDNAACESFLRALKREEIHGNDYRDLEHLNERIVEFIERYYNRCRLHSALGYRSPRSSKGKRRVETATTPLRLRGLARRRTSGTRSRHLFVGKSKKRSNCRV
jgi:hypothetical protein